MTQNLYIAPQRFSEDLLTLCEIIADGIVVGDLFCQKRMFENENYDLPDICRRLKKANHKVIFQTPVYNTTRSIESTLSLIRKLDSENLLDSIFIHDPGMLAELGKSGNYELWWDRFSFNRDIIPNLSLIKFLLNNGVTKVEIQRIKDIRPVVEAGIGVLLHAYGPNISTFGRICYSEYFKNEPCGRKILCKDKTPFIVSCDKVPVQYEADGYCLLDKSDPLLNHFPDLTSEVLSIIDGISVFVSCQKEMLRVDEMFQEKKYGENGILNQIKS